MNITISYEKLWDTLKWVLWRVVALLFVAAALGWLGHRSDQHDLARLETLSAQEVRDCYKHLHSHSYGWAFLVVFGASSFLLAIVELLAYVLRGITRKLFSR